jgi:hypothetical protein
LLLWSVVAAAEIAVAVAAVVLVPVA